jgi:hypothetical protein
MEERFSLIMLGTVLVVLAFFVGDSSHPRHKSLADASSVISLFSTSSSKISITSTSIADFFIIDTSTSTDANIQISTITSGTLPVATTTPIILTTPPTPATMTPLITQYKYLTAADECTLNKYAAQGWRVLQFGALNTGIAGGPYYQADCRRSSPYAADWVLLENP